MNARSILSEVICACELDAEAPLFNAKKTEELRQLHCSLLCHEGDGIIKVDAAMSDAVLAVGLKAGELARESTEDPERLAGLKSLAAECLAFVKTGAAGENYLPWSLM